MLAFLVYALPGILACRGQTGLPAFPGAGGHGKYTTGGRGGRVLYVTNLTDDNTAGSLRYAVNQTGARIILFKVSGTIRLKSKLSIKNGNVTIAGQTAPGDGITLRDYPVDLGSNNIIIRFMRFRMGDVTTQEADAFGGRERKNIMIDHCSMSWSTDECVSMYQNENTTLQWCIISESLRNSVHDKGAHGYGGIWGGKNASFHHNLLAHHDSRNPRLGEINKSAFALTDRVDLRNNVIYNWGGNSCYGGEAMNVNIVNCYYKPGPGTSKRERIISIDRETETGAPTTGIWGKFYIDGNVLTASTRATADNWTYGVYNQFHGSYGTVSEQDKAAMRMALPHNPGEVTTHTAETAYEKVMEYGGASLVRDTVDRRIIREVRTGTATYMTGGNGSANGIIDTQTTVGGWPELTTLPAPADSDTDGMPDGWEEANGLDKNNPADALLTTVDGTYPNLEAYLYSLVAGITENQEKEALTSAPLFPFRHNHPLKLGYDPASGLLTILFHTVMEMAALYTVSGILVEKSTPGREKTGWDLRGLDPGIYIVQVYDQQMKPFSAKFIKP